MKRLLLAILLLIGQSDTALGFGILALTMIVLGLLNGPLDIGMFTLRQRRTDRAWMGRAFAISMALNFSGFPFGAALAGAVAAQSIDLAIVAAVIFAAVAAALAAIFVPRQAPDIAASANQQPNGETL